MEAFDNLTAAVAIHLTESASFARLHLTNLTASAGLEVSPEAVVYGAFFALCGLVILAVLLMRIVGAVRARERARHNTLAVQMAEDAPEDDCDEHEVAVRDDSRTPAPGDSDFEEDVLTSKT